MWQELINALRAMAAFLLGGWAMRQEQRVDAATRAHAAERAVADAAGDTHDERLQRLQARGRLRSVPTDKRDIH